MNCYSFVMQTVTTDELISLFVARS